MYGPGQAYVESLPIGFRRSLAGDMSVPPPFMILAEL